MGVEVMVLVGVRKDCLHQKSTAVSATNDAQVCMWWENFDLLGSAGKVLKTGHFHCARVFDKGEAAEQQPGAGGSSSGSDDVWQRGRAWQGRSGGATASNPINDLVHGPPMTPHTVQQ
ncbi:hypothetical protein QAD02_020537 [Eretmocerus hayati]|uniref:Uncharacterized protein n=1 Tax=Eretmocerus hayati TaxID=131215 RepID=A0ACC2PMD4_9HYME|nr:hypothetical protein QAD02_020537 [Eretmocerus hayati]